MRLPKTLDMLKTLVGEPSVSCVDPAIDQSNVAVVDHLASWLDDLGFDVETHPVPWLGEDGEARAGKCNLIARRGRGIDGLVLAGHTDTVPFDDALWSTDPFAVTERDDRFYGLGTCDMKGFFPLALSALERHRDSRLAKPLTVIATADEESTFAGARLLASRGEPRAAAAVIGEPTGMTPIRAHKGFTSLSIQVTGSSGHSSNPALGDNALDAMHRVMGALIAFRRELAERHQDPAFEVAVPTLNLGCLHAGDNPNRICGHAELKIDLRVLPGMDTAAVVDDAAERVLRACGDTAVEVTTINEPVQPYQTPADGALVKSVEALSGRQARTVAFGTEAPFYQSLGMETVVFGAGSIDQAHQPDEYLDAAQIKPMEDALTALIAQYCC
jgi:acetylornithine deacetylase